MNKKNKRVRHLGRKVNNLVMLLMLVSMTLMVILCIYMFNHQTMRMLENRCVNGTEAELALISAGRGNSYGHPAQETLDRLNALGTDIRRTDQDGTVTVRVRNGAVGVF